MRRDVDVQDASPVVGQDDKVEQETERGGGDHEEVAGCGVVEVVLEEGSPALRGRSGPFPDHVLGNGGFSYLVTEQAELGLDSRSASEGILPGHSMDQLDHFRGNYRAFFSLKP